MNNNSNCEFFSENLSGFWILTGMISAGKKNLQVIKALNRVFGQHLCQFEKSQSKMQW